MVVVQSFVFKAAGNENRRVKERKRDNKIP